MAPYLSAYSIRVTLISWGRYPSLPLMAVATFWRYGLQYLIGGDVEEDFEVFFADGLDLILLQELLESPLEGLETEVDLVDCVPGIDVDQVLILVDGPAASELATCLLN
jgi:hypothetical protein